MVSSRQGLPSWIGAASASRVDFEGNVETWACLIVERNKCKFSVGCADSFKETKGGMKPAGLWKSLVGVINPVTSTNCVQNLQNYRVLRTCLSSQLARDVPFSAICWATLEPIRRKLLASVGDEAGGCSILGANFATGVEQEALQLLLPVP
ncbi:hypothetical protein F3Y22_tig00015910pilonHSYRG00036 [Hibiscus syriacus]|uniref:Uncharacterized protein n=1 Tax=Hibiscus syriacus TaxID=106335 RepID=A0A6A3C1F7_HIBSY|nr:hypothetical protein F3Y22_tig00015910pilonHSYRG00036 [Hibiscus syriacus]